MQKKRSVRNAIALLTTVFFIMLITVSVGVGLKYIQEGKKGVYEEQVMLQTSVVTLDILEILKNSKDLQAIDSAEGLYYFLDAFSLIPFSTAGFDVLVTLESARSKINPNIFRNPNPKADINPNTEIEEAFELFLSNNQVDVEYKDMLVDLVSGIIVDATYRTDIFNEHPYLFRDYISSYEHLDELNQMYTIKFHNQNLDKLKVENLFYPVNPSNDSNYTIDWNYATDLTKELILGSLYERENPSDLEEREEYQAIDALGVGEEEMKRIKMFGGFSIFEPYLDVTINLSQGKYSSTIRFEYDINKSKGSNFVLKI